MRTTPFKRIFDRVVRWNGRDPRKEVPPDMREAVVERINDRVRQIWQAWRWPEWERTEERAFRPVWNSAEQYYIMGTDGNPDEIYYLTNQTYYRVNSDAPEDPPIGTVPTNGTYFGVMTPVDTFIAYDQACKRSIGMMLGVYRQNPRTPTCSSNGWLYYMPSERGIDVYCPGVPTVWITYKRPDPVYTMLPYVSGKTYARAEVVFDPSTGECFQATEATTAAVTDTVWNWVPFISTWEKYVTNGAFADSLVEFDQGGNTEIQAKMVLAQAADMRANDALQSEVDALATQGQKLKWTFDHRFDGWCRSLPWCGGEITELSESIQPFQSIVTDEEPGGVVNGTNSDFTTTYGFSTLWVFLNGLKLIRDTDYTITSTTGFTITSAPTGGDTLTVDYIRV